MVYMNAFYAPVAALHVHPIGGVKVVPKITWAPLFSFKLSDGFQILETQLERNELNNSLKEHSNYTSATLL
jgi:hypothetical protein